MSGMTTAAAAVSSYLDPPVYMQVWFRYLSMSSSESVFWIAGDAVFLSMEFVSDRSILMLLFFQDGESWNTSPCTQIEKLLSSLKQWFLAFLEFIHVEGPVIHHHLR